MHCSCHKSRIHLSNLYGRHRYGTIITAACLALTSQVHRWHEYVKELKLHLTCRQQWTDSYDATVQNEVRRDFELLQHGEKLSRTNCYVCKEQYESPNFGLKQAQFLATTMTQLPADSNMPKSRAKAVSTNS